MLTATTNCCAQYVELFSRGLNLPPNMTDVLQVMDLVVNAPLKAGIRRVRCDSLYDYFQKGM